MNKVTTIQKLEEMRMSGFVRAFREIMETGRNKDFTKEEIISHLVQAEWDDRYNRRLKRLITRARFRYQASMEQIDYVAKRELDKNQMLSLSTCSWINNRQNIIISGSTGLGKSFLSSALGHQACMQGYKVFYRNCSKLFDELKIAKADGTYIKEIGKIEKHDLLILDDFAYSDIFIIPSLSLNILFYNLIEIQFSE
jgi:DNA replication protein DnaC